MTATTGHPYTPIPAAFADAVGSTIADELAAYTVDLRAENKARATRRCATDPDGG